MTHMRASHLRKRKRAPCFEQLGDALTGQDDRNERKNTRAFRRDVTHRNIRRRCPPAGTPQALAKSMQTAAMNLPFVHKKYKHAFLLSRNPSSY
ncbi:MAG: hypothetical protein CML51_05680 [Rhodobacteraceae bacterium]|nr:hypothetical protein [Paracoccaceae bacterium]